MYRTCTRITVAEPIELRSGDAVVSVPQLSPSLVALIRSLLSNIDRLVERIVAAIRTGVDDYATLKNESIDQDVIRAVGFHAHVWLETLLSSGITWLAPSTSTARRWISWMTGFRSFRNATFMIAGVELAHRIRKRQFSFGLGRQRRAWSLKQLCDRALAWESHYPTRRNCSFWATAIAPEPINVAIP